MRFSVLAVKMFFTNPAALVRLVKNFTKKSDEVEDSEDYGELFSIGVSADSQGKGVGKKILAATEEAIKAMNVEKLSLTTDFYDNDATLGFYRSMGYEVYIYDNIHKTDT